MSGAKRPDPKGPKARGGERERQVRRESATDATSASLYERYKDALRRGHVAALRGRHDAAIEAYQEAAAIAPDRALPHASIGATLTKMNRPADAIAAYRRAIEIAPRDETALRGLAETLTRLGRRAEAARALDRLADGLDAGGRLVDATDAARRALELAESRTRRAILEALVSRLRGATPDDAAERVLGQAAAALAAAGSPTEGSFDRESGGDGSSSRPAGLDDLGPEAESGASSPELQSIDPVNADSISDPAGAAGDVVDPEAGADEATTTEAIPSQPAVGGPLDEADVAAATPEVLIEPIAEPAGLGIALGAVAEARLHAGDLAEAHEGLLAAARAHRRAGRLVAAVDACDLAISIAPADPDLHLLLAELYLDRGWRTLASEKLQLLGRIAELDGDAATRERLCAVASARLPDDLRLAELCA